LYERERKPAGGVSRATLNDVIRTSDPRRQSGIFVLLTAPAPSIGALFAFHLAPGGVGQAVYALGKVVLYGMPLLWWWMARGLDRPRPPRTTGGWGLGVVAGLLLGGAILTAWLFFLRGRIDVTALRAQAVASGFDTPARYLLVAAWLTFVNAILEEYAFRWFFYGRLRDLVGPWAGGVAAALIFTAHHVIVLRAFFPWTIVLLGSAGVFIAGLVWTWLYERCGRIGPAALSHMLTDAALLAVGWMLLFPAG